MGRLLCARGNGEIALDACERKLLWAHVIRKIPFRAHVNGNITFRAKGMWEWGNYFGRV